MRQPTGNYNGAMRWVFPLDKLNNVCLPSLVQTLFVDAHVWELKIRQLLKDCYVVFSARRILNILISNGNSMENDLIFEEEFEFGFFKSMDVVVFVQKHYYKFLLLRPHESYVRKLIWHITIPEKKRSRIFIRFIGFMRSQQFTKVPTS